DELPEAHVEVTEAKGGFGGMGGGNYGASRFDDMTHFGSSYGTPGWQRAQKRTTRPSGFEEDESQECEDLAPDDPPPPPDQGALPRPRGGPCPVGAAGAAPPPPAAPARSPSRASWSPSRPARPPSSPSATGCFIRNSATATSSWLTATSSPSRSTRRARRRWWI